MNRRRFLGACAQAGVAIVTARLLRPTKRKAPAVVLIGKTLTLDHEVELGDDSIIRNCNITLLPGGFFKVTGKRVVISNSYFQT